MALTLTRKTDQAITFYDADGEVIGVLRVKEVRGLSVRLSLDFDSSIRIERDDMSSIVEPLNQEPDTESA